MEIFLWLVINAVVGAAIGARKNMVAGAIALAIFLGPIGWIIALVIEGDFRKCPFCAENVKDEAIVCPHCQRDLPAKPVSLLKRPPPPPRHANPAIWIGLGTAIAIIILIAIALALVYERKDPADMMSAASPSPRREFVKLIVNVSVRSTNGTEIKLPAGLRVPVILRYGDRITIEYDGGNYPILANVTVPAK